MLNLWQYRLRIADCGLWIRKRLPSGVITQQWSQFTAGRRRLNPSARNPKSETRNPQFSGLTLLEMVISTLIVGLMTVAALNGLGAATRSADSIGNRAVALGLADELMSEILNQAYSDLEDPTSFGFESGETIAGPRSVFDDVDDYHGWNKSPPRYYDGTAMPDRTLWRHRVEVTRVSPSDPTQTSVTDQGAKRIRVTIEYDDQVMAELIAVRTDCE